MKLARVGIIAAAVLAVATMACAQKPDFSGTWTLDAEASGAPAGGGGGGGGGGRGGGGGLGMGGTVKQTADTLTDRARPWATTRSPLTYKLDGTESKNTMMGRGGQPMESVSTAKWDGGKLIDHHQGRRKREHPGLVARRQRPHHRDDQRARHAEEGLQEDDVRTEDRRRQRDRGRR